MPTSIPDLAWYVSTGAVVILMTVIAALLGWGFKLLISKLDTLTDKLDLWVVKIAHIEEKLNNHIVSDDTRHNVLADQISKLSMWGIVNNGSKK